MEFRGVQLPVPCTITVPSGNTFDHEDMCISICMAQNKSIELLDKPVTFFSGRKSHCYVRLREDLTRDPEFKALLGEKICYDIRRFSSDALETPHLIGIPYAGIALAEAASNTSQYLSCLKNGYTKAFPSSIMRNERKAHGKHNSWVEGGAGGFAGLPWLIDNTITDGQSKLRYAGRLREDGFVDARHIRQLIVVNRDEGGVENLQNAGFTRIHCCYHLPDLLALFEALGLWTNYAVAIALKEIAEARKENKGLPPEALAENA